MSVSHFFYVNAELKGFPQELIDQVSKLVSASKRLVSGSHLDKEHIAVAFPASRPSAFYITTKKQDCMLSLRDKAWFSSCKYYNGKYNALFCEIALLCKYYLREHLTIVSDGFECGLDGDWREAVKVMNEKGFNIKVEALGEGTDIDVFIDGEKVLNEFDKNGEIFNSMFELVIKE